MLSPPETKEALGQTLSGGIEFLASYIYVGLGLGLWSGGMLCLGVELNDPSGDT